jgi:hypothetical protein
MPTERPDPGILRALPFNLFHPMDYEPQDFLTLLPTVSRSLTGGEIVAIIFGLLLGLALLLGIHVFRSRCWLVPVPPHSVFLGPFASSEALTVALMTLLSPTTKAQVYPSTDPVHPVPDASGANSARAHWTTEVVLGPEDAASPPQKKPSARTAEAA